MPGFWTEWGGFMALQKRIRMKNGRRRVSGGFTLVEVVLSLGILTTAILGAMMAVYGNHRQNRLTVMEITARNVMRAQVEEIMSVATDAMSEAPPTGVAKLEAAQGILRYYASDEMRAETVVGPGGVDSAKVFFDDGHLICLFSIPDAGFSGRESGENGTEKQLLFNRRALGRMTLYLDETRVGPDDTATAMWNDLGTGTGGVTTGFDMDGDGAIRTPSFTASFSLLRDSPQDTGIKQLPIDIEVFFFDNESHDRLIYSTRRRMVAASSYDLSSMLDG